MSKINIILKAACPWPAGGKKLQLFLMGSFHKSLVNDWRLLRSSCTRLKIARFLPDSVLTLNMQFSTRSQSTIPSTCISLTAAWHQHYNEGSDWLLCKLNIRTCHCVWVTHPNNGQILTASFRHTLFFQWAEHLLSVCRGLRQNTPSSV